MSVALDMAETAALIGDVARANILSTLLDGRASTALELTIAAGVTPPTAPRISRNSSMANCCRSTGRAVIATSGWRRRTSRRCWNR